MSRPKFMMRLYLGQLNQWEQALAVGLTGLICALLFTAAIVLTGRNSGGSNTMMIPKAALIFGAIGVFYGTILGFYAPVNPLMDDRPENSTDFPAEQDKSWIVAFVWPSQRSTPNSLRALGEELIEWRKDKDAVTKIMGLDRLLAGRYPSAHGPAPYVEDPDGDPMPCPQITPEGRLIEMEFRKMKVVKPWIFCPVVIWADERMKADETIESLRLVITPELISSVGYYFH